ncbi:phosphatase PAP2 family protein [Sphingomonas sp.]|uniref:phosphatase PAP2 family protein n=1 Tax=Sphingomonas sp. TaxID=28214 RepID=UPI003CC59B05
MQAKTTTGPAIPGAWMIAGAGLGITAITGLMYRAGLKVDLGAPSTWPFYICALVVIGLCVGLRNPVNRRQHLVRDLAEYLGLATLIALFGALASYPQAAESQGFIDAALTRADAAIGFDWLSWYRVVAAHPVLQVAGRLAYDSIFWMPAAILAAFAANGRRDRARGMIAALAVAAATTLALFRLMPAVGPLAYLWHGPVPYMPVSALWQPELIPPLRQHQIHYVDVGALRGLVSMPSFHTAAAVIFMVSAWTTPQLRWPVLGVNAAMLLATPVEGTHYLVDMIAGAGVAAASLLLVALVHAQILPRLSRRDRAMRMALTR